MYAVDHLPKSEGDHIPPDLLIQPVDMKNCHPEGSQRVCPSKVLLENSQQAQ